MCTTDRKNMNIVLLYPGLIGGQGHECCMHVVHSAVACNDVDIDCSLPFALVEDLIKFN